jgi:hypothetical protein
MYNPLIYNPVTDTSSWKGMPRGVRFLHSFQSTGPVQLVSNAERTKSQGSASVLIEGQTEITLCSREVERLAGEDQILRKRWRSR